MSALKDLGQWREETDAHLARLDLVTEQHGEDLRAKRAADNKTLTAIRETQTEHGRKLDAIDVKLDNLGGGLRKVDRASESLQADMGMVKGRLGKVEGRLGKVEGELGEVKGRLGKVEGRLGKVEGELGEVKGRLGKVEGELGEVKGRLGKVEDNLGKVEDRLGKVEDKLGEFGEKLDLLLSR